MKTSTKNAAYEWSCFDPEVYFQRNYSHPHPSDLEIIEHLGRFYASCPDNCDVIDIGTGPNLYPLLAALPKAKSITAWEYGKANVDWLTRELNKKRMRPCWYTFLRILRTQHAMYRNMRAVSALQSKVKIRQSSIFDLPEKSWDVATMFFCAESITKDEDEFHEGLMKFRAALKANGRFFAAFMERSTGYEVDGMEFPAISLTRKSLKISLDKFFSEFEVAHVGLHGKRLRKGYSGMLVAWGKR